jgi:hypothetical protein
VSSGNAAATHFNLNIPSENDGGKAHHGRETRLAWKGIELILRGLTSSPPKSSIQAMEESEQWSDDMSAWVTACPKPYFERFHHHWPVLHAPVFDLESEPLIIAASVIVISLWLQGSKDMMDLVLNIHNVLMDKFFQEMVS